MSYRKNKSDRPAHRKQRTGIVTSDKMTASIVVKVERKVKHLVYNKFMSKSKKFMVHDPENKAKEGDMVKIMETRPLSKSKRWRLVEIITAGK